MLTLNYLSSCTHISFYNFLLQLFKNKSFCNSYIYIFERYMFSIYKNHISLYGFKATSLTSYFRFYQWSSLLLLFTLELVTTTQLSIKLSSSNHPTWYKQVTLFLTANNVFDYVSRTLPCPPATIETGDTAVENPIFLAWKR